MSMDEDDAELPELVVVETGDEMDLHGFAPEQIAEVAREYLDSAWTRGYRTVRLIHGRGVGVQRERIRALLARDPRVLWFGDAASGDGGWGATVVEFRRDALPLDPA